LGATTASTSLHWRGRQRRQDSRDAAAHGANIIAICDVDKRTQDKKLRNSQSTNLTSQCAKAKRFQDYRKLLDEMGKDIDAVTVSTPDHNHGWRCSRMKMGKHCFCRSR